MAHAPSVHQLLDELGRLRVRAARGTGKIRLSLRDIAAASGVPHSSLANYLSGATLMPCDVLDAVVLALGATRAEARDWAQAWEHAIAAEPAVRSAKRMPRGAVLEKLDRSASGASA